MAKCLNCDKDAVYLIDKRGQKPQAFCEKDLPWAWKNAKAAEGLKRIDVEVAAPTPPVVEEPKKTSTKKKSEEPEVKEEVDEDREDNN